MKIFGLVGSPRKGGNTDILVQTALKGAQSQGAETSIVYLNDLNIRGCQACYACKKTGRCSVNDDMQIIYRLIDESDAVIIGSPIYFGRISAQLAPVMDRFFAYLKPDFTTRLRPGKKYSLIFSYTQPDFTCYLPCINAIAQVLDWLGFEPGYEPFVGAGLADAGAVLKNRLFLDAASAMGKTLVTK